MGQIKLRVVKKNHLRKERHKGSRRATFDHRRCFEFFQTEQRLSTLKSQGTVTIPMQPERCNQVREIVYVCESVLHLRPLSDDIWEGKGAKSLSLSLLSLSEVSPVEVFDTCGFLFRFVCFKMCI